jgi:hypothetical protein
MNRFIDPRSLVFFRIRNEDGTENVESLWAQDLGQDRYRIDNCPFYACGVSLHDIVHAPRDPGSGIATVDQVLSKSGNRTIRLFFARAVAPGNSSARILEALVSLGCGYEGADRHFIAVNIPSRLRLAIVCDYLAEQGVMWEYADPEGEDLAGE